LSPTPPRRYATSFFHIYRDAAASTRAIWCRPLFQHDSLATLLADPQCPEPGGIICDGHDGDPLGVECPLKVLQPLPAIGPGLRHDVLAFELEDVKGEE
jgi:hypothetical protein